MNSWAYRFSHTDSEPNKTTEEKFPTPNTEDQWQNSIMTLQESQYFINIEQERAREEIWSYLDMEDGLS